MKKKTKVKKENKQIIEIHVYVHQDNIPNYIPPIYPNTPGLPYGPYSPTVTFKG